MLQFCRCFSQLIVAAVCLLALPAFAQSGYYERQIDTPSEYWLKVSQTNTLDNGRLVVAQTQTTSGQWRYSFIKFDSAGILQWKTRFATSGSTFQNVVQASDSSFFFCYLDTIPFERYNVIKVDASGAVIFESAFNITGQGNIIGIPVIMAKSDNGLYVACAVSDYVADSAYWNLISLDPNGLIIWSNVFNADSLYCSLTGIDTCSNGDIVLCGDVIADQLDANLAACRISPGGNLLWSERFLAPGRRLMSTSVTRIGNDDIIVSGNSPEPLQNKQEMFVIKLNGQGGITWSYTIVDTAYRSYPLMIRRLENEDVGAAGIFQSYVFPSPTGGCFIKIDSAGNPLVGNRYWWGSPVYTFDTLHNGDYQFVGIDQNASVYAPDGALVIFTADSNGSSGCHDTLMNLMRLPLSVTAIPLYGERPYPLSQAIHHVNDGDFNLYNLLWCSVTDIQESENEPSPVNIFPSPVTDVLQFRSEHEIRLVELKDIHGRTILCMELNATEGQIPVNTLPNGIYLACLHSEKEILIQKVVIDCP